MTQHNLPELPDTEVLGFDREDQPICGHTNKALCAYALAALSSQGAVEAVAGKWDGAEEWMPLAWALCADECGEEACTELVWECGPIPEPWGDRWLKYEDEAKRLISLVRKHTRPKAAQPDHTDLLKMIAHRARCFPSYPMGYHMPEVFGAIGEEPPEPGQAAQPARVVGTVTGYQSASGAQQWQFTPSAGAAGLETQRFEVALAAPPAAPTPSQQADGWATARAQDSSDYSREHLTDEPQAVAVTELEDVKRWFMNQETGMLVQTERGPWVRYVDVLAAFEAKKAGQA